MKISYSWICELAGINTGPKDLAERLTMVGLAVDSIEPWGDDYILDFDLTSNRPDALSHLGVAREAALVCGSVMKRSVIRLEDKGEAIEAFTSIVIEDADLCPRYVGRVIRGVKVGPSPKWLVDRLESIGQRPVNNIADITNYVMFEMGQPTHAFDLNRLKGRQIIVRRAKPGEIIRTLDGFERKLTPEMLVIADAERPVAMAGIMGGEDTEINPDTVDVLLESAFFTPLSVRKTARALGMATEASYRFERGADFEGQLLAADRGAQMIAEIAGGVVLHGAIDVYPEVIRKDPVALRESRIEHITGVPVTIEEAAEILRKLEFIVEQLAERKELLAAPPSFRVDVFREEDLIEEVVRHAGYDKIKETLPPWGGAGVLLTGEDKRRKIRRILTTMGFDEAISFSFVDGRKDALFRSENTGVVNLTNPIDANETEMRSSILTGLVESLQRNLFQGIRDVKLFEFGRTFEASMGVERPREYEKLGFVMIGSAADDGWRGARPLDFYDIKGAVEAAMGCFNLADFTIERASVEYLHPGQSAVFSLDGVELARIGALHPRVASVYKFRQTVLVAEIEFEKILKYPIVSPRYSSLPKLPSSSRDVSALVPDTVSWNEIVEAVSGLGFGEIVSVNVFDVYKGRGIPDGMRSLAFRVTYRSGSRTLTDEEVASMHEQVRNLLQARFDAQLR